MKKIFVFIMILLTVTLYAGEKHNFTFYDMIKMVRLSSPVVSPDGKYIAFTGTKYSLEKNKGNTDIYLYNTKTGQTRKLTNNEAGDFNPVFSKDGKYLYFLSTRSGKSELYRLDLSGGEPEKVSDYPVSIANFKISPKGNYFSFTANVYPETSDFEKIAEIDKKKKENKCTAKVYTSLFIRHWDTWEDGKWTHVFYVKVKDGKPYGKPHDIMKGIDGNCPSEPFGDSSEYSWSPDETMIGFTTKRGRDRAWTTNFDVYLYDLKTGKYKNLTEKNKAWDTSPVFDGKGNIYYLAMKTPGYEADRFRIMKMNLKTGKIENLSEKYEVNPHSLLLDNDKIYFTALWHAHIRVYEFDLKTGKLKELVSKHDNNGLTKFTNTLYFMQNSLTSPNELYSFNLHSKKLQKLTHINDQLVNQIKFSQPEEFWFTNRDGIKVHGWLLKPVPFDKNKKYPLAFYIHGGPQGSWEDNFHYRWNLQILPAQGYVAVAIDFRGSTGYGDKFKEAISGHWGDKPFNDLMDGLNYVLKTYKFIDKDRMGPLGASYGGYMINWIAGNAPDTFKCLICHDGLFDTFNSYYATEELWFPEHEFGGTAYDNPQGYDKWSPARYVKNWKTPMLIIHGGRDYRVVPTEGISAFTACQRKGIPSKLIFFPDENHFVLKPKNSEFWHKSVIEWMDRWLKNKK